MWLPSVQTHSQCLSEHTHTLPTLHRLRRYRLTQTSCAYTYIYSGFIHLVTTSKLREIKILYEHFFLYLINEHITKQPACIPKIEYKEHTLETKQHSPIFKNMTQEITKAFPKPFLYLAFICTKYLPPFSTYYFKTGVF